MIKPEHIPEEVAWKLHDKLWSVGGHSVDDVRAAIAAALSAWEGAKTVRDDGRRQTYAIPAIILPLTQQDSDE